MIGHTQLTSKKAWTKYRLAYLFRFWVNFFQKIANAEEPKFNNPTLSISNHQKPSGSSDGERINGSFDQQVF